jgi:hypothetical protein
VTQDLPDQRRGRLAGRVAVIGGAGSVGPGWGNGRATAVIFAREGATVFLADRDKESLEVTARQIRDEGGTAYTAVLDVTEPTAVEAYFAECEQAAGRIDILVNNVGGSRAGGAVELSLDDWESQLRTNLTSAFLACKHVIPVMRRGGGGAIVADEEALDLLEAARDHVFVAPTPGIIHANLHEADSEPEPGMEVEATAEAVRKVVPELVRRGVRVVPGGDYGFAWNPVGRNLRDLELFVDWFGFTPAEALRAATLHGGQIMGMGDELGLIREGFLADLVLVDGDPLVEIAILQDRDRLAAIMKDGVLYKAPA